MANEIVAIEQGRFEKAPGTIVKIAERATRLMETVRFPNPEGYKELDEILTEVHEAEKHAEGVRVSLVKPLNDHVDTINKMSRVKELKTFKDLIRSTMQIYARAEMAWKREEEERAAKIERKRLEDERIAKAAQAEKAGKKEEAERLIETPVVVRKQEAITGTETAKAAVKTVWRFEITDAKALLQGVVDGIIPLAAVTINQGFLDRQAALSKAEMKWPGGKAIEDVAISSGRR